MPEDPPPSPALMRQASGYRAPGPTRWQRRMGKIWPSGKTFRRTTLSDRKGLRDVAAPAGGAISAAPTGRSFDGTSADRYHPGTLRVRRQCRCGRSCGADNDESSRHRKRVVREELSIGDEGPTEETARRPLMSRREFLKVCGASVASVALAASVVGYLLHKPPVRCCRTGGKGHP